MVALLLYAYAIGERSSRQIERRCREDVAFRVLTANLIPDHATIARFRARHDQALADTFTQVLALCARAGLVSVGVVALDGSLLAGNASPAATRNYSSIVRRSSGCSARRRRLTLPRMSGSERRAVMSCRPISWTRAHVVSGCATASYNAQVVASPEQVILAAQVTQSHNDSDQLEPMVAQTTQMLQQAGINEPIGTLLADGGCWNSPAITQVREQGIEVLIPTHDRRRAKPRKLSVRQGEEARRIDAVLSTPEGQTLYRRRQQIVEPVFAQTKCIRRTDRFLRRGLAACQAEWQLITATHNLLKLWRAGLAQTEAAIPEPMAG